MTGDRQGAGPGPLANMARLRALAGEILANRKAWVPEAPNTDPTKVRVPRRLGRCLLGREREYDGRGLLFDATDVEEGSCRRVRVVIAGEHVSRESIARFLRYDRLLGALGRQRTRVGIYDLGVQGSLLYYTASLVGHVRLEDTFTAGKADPFESVGWVLPFQEDEAAARDEAVARLEAVARFLHLAHGVGVVHGDLRPETIHLDGAGRPRLVDFGLVEGAAEVARYSGEWAPLGYLAPEQLGIGAGGVDGRADIYALGGILLFLWMGEPPHMAGTLEEARATIADPTALTRTYRPDWLPPEIRQICHKCLAVRPEERYPTAGALAEDLARYLRPRGEVPRNP